MTYQRDPDGFRPTPTAIPRSRDFLRRDDGSFGTVLPAILAFVFMLIFGFVLLNVVSHDNVTHPTTSESTERPATPPATSPTPPATTPRQP